MLKIAGISPAARWLTGALLASLTVLAIFLYAGLNGTETSSPGHADRITIGVATNIDSALVYVAESRGYFRERSLDVVIMDYSAGLMAVQDLAAGRVDMATCADMVFAIQSAELMELRVFATVARAEDHEILYRKDGVSAPADLKGKRIAVTLKTSAHFFLETFLSFYGVPRESVQMVNLAPPDIVKSMIGGTVDAACTWEPNVERIKNALGSEAFAWPAQKGRSYNWLVVAGNDFLKANPSAVGRFLRALLDAETHARLNPHSAREIIAKRLSLTEKGVKFAWPKFDLRVTLDQDLINIMEDQARWAMRRGLLPGKQVPNYFDRIELGPLEQINPDMVGIIH